MGAGEATDYPAETSDPSVSRETSEALLSSPRLAALGDAAQARMEAYVELVRAWAGRVDLVSPGDLARFESRHVEDSLAALPALDEAPEGVCADVGSGAGLPGIPLAIARPDRRWRLLEPRGRRAAFLEEVVRALGLDCEVLVRRAEEGRRDPRLAAAHALVTARALAPPVKAFAMILPLVAQGGTALVFVSRSAEVPLQAEVLDEGIAIIRSCLP